MIVMEKENKLTVLAKELNNDVFKVISADALVGFEKAYLIIKRLLACRDPPLLFDRAGNQGFKVPDHTPDTVHL